MAKNSQSFLNSIFIMPRETQHVYTCQLVIVGMLKISKETSVRQSYDKNKIVQFFYSHDIQCMSSMVVSVIDIHVL